MSVKVFYTSVSGSVEMKKRQERILSVLSSTGVTFDLIDISQDSANKEKMRRIAGNPTALAPQIANGDTYCGDFEAFENAIENGELQKFLKL
ncbi:SH3 domain-binding glutamic acid-rich-like protein 3 [Sphaeramia orbicularis]|uniref:SH3 domain-binding glutamic acid-rich-like protein 3 n=1 Tax=Sphaeramia orbicularis TaxID=375764 RepID=A0A673BAW6_9TELE|nr:SH3 domain-binding glutamic acid-rich-like protein 3 [Sphaeramia orbicularis]